MDKMIDEMRSFIKAWMVVIASLTYTYFISSKLPKGQTRLLSILPVIPIFALLPLLHSSFYLQFYFGPCIAWLANFKLLLFAFGKEDTYSIRPSTPLFHFILLIALPIKINNKKQTSLSYPIFIVNTLIWTFMIQMYVTYNEHVLLENPSIVHFLYSARMLFGIQVHFALYAALGRLVLGQELEKQFDEPHLSTSLQNFWGKRWNLMVSSILRSSIHEPTKSYFRPIVGKRYAMHCAILSTFVVSGLMHEVMHFYVGRRWPTWEVMWFFVVHGVCLCVEIETKKAAERRGWKLPWMVSTTLTAGFVMVTGIWLCYAELIHWGADVREVEELMGFIDYMKLYLPKNLKSAQPYNHYVPTWTS